MYCQQVEFTSVAMSKVVAIYIILVVGYGDILSVPNNLRSLKTVFIQYFTINYSLEEKTLGLIK